MNAVLAPFSVQFSSPKVVSQNNGLEIGMFPYWKLTLFPENYLLCRTLRVEDAYLRDVNRQDYVQQNSLILSKTIFPPIPSPKVWIGQPGSQFSSLSVPHNEQHCEQWLSLSWAVLLLGEL